MVRVLPVYLAAAVVLTWPLAARFTTHVPSGPSDQDVFLFLWNNWWIQHAVVALHAKPYITDFIYAPFTTDLRFTSSGLLYGLLSIPLYRLIGPVAVLNVQVIATAALNGWAVLVLVRRLTRDTRAAFVCGLVMAATPAIDFHLALGRATCAAVWPGILMVDFFLRLLERPGTGSAAGFAIFAIATLMGDQEAALFFAGWLLILLIHAAATRSGRSALLDRRFVVRAAAAGAIAAAPAWFLYLKPFLTTTGYTVPASTEALRYSYPVWLLWSPALIWRVYGLMAPIGLLAWIARRRRTPGIAPWAIGSVAFIILSFGPVAMGTNVPLPFQLLTLLPGMAQFRTPYRFQIGAVVGMIVMLGFALTWLLASARPRMARAVVALAVLLASGDLVAHRVRYGFALQTMPPHPVYETIASDSRDCVILEVPVGVRTGTDRIGPGESLSFYQPIHHKRLINGSTSRMPLPALAYYRASPAIMLLAGDAPTPGDAAADLRRLIGDLHIGYVVVHPDMLDRAALDRALALLATAGRLTRIDSGDELIAFRVQSPSP